MSENYIVINGKRAELTKEQMKQLGIKVEEEKRWRADHRTRYWFIDSQNRTETDEELRQRKDDFRYYLHNYFRTKEEAETYARILETEMLLEKYADEHNGKFDKYKYFLYACANGPDSIDIACIDLYYGHIIGFSNYDIAKNAIKEIGKERIIEYLTYEWDEIITDIGDEDVEGESNVDL